MKGTDKKAPGPADAIHNTLKPDCRIPHAGFVALRHLLDASRQLHEIPALPSDALHGAAILMRRIESDIERLKGQRP